MISGASAIFDTDGKFLYTLTKDDAIPIEKEGKLIEFYVKGKKIRKYSGILIGNVESLVLYDSKYLIPKDIFDTHRNEIEKEMKRGAKPRKLGEGSFGVVSLIFPEYIVIKTFTSKELITDDQVSEVYMQSLFKGCSCSPQILMFEARSIYSTYGGISLYKYMKDNPKLSLEDVRDKLKTLILCLDFYSKFDIIHRDIKPENILIHPNGHLMLADWGESIRSNAKMKALRKGSRLFNAPEQLGKHSYDYDVIDLKSDVFSLSQIMCDFLGNSFTKDRTRHLTKDVEIDDKVQKDHECDLFIPRVEYTNTLTYYSKLLLKDLDKYQKRYSGDEKLLLADYIDLIKHCAKVNPEERYTYQDMLNHPFFAEAKVVDTTGSCSLKELGISDIHPSDNQREKLKKGFSYIDNNVFIKFIYSKNSVDLNDFFFKCCDTLSIVITKFDIDLDIKDICNCVIYIVSCILGIPTMYQMYPECAVKILSLGSNVILKTRKDVTKEMYLSGKIFD